MTEQTKVTKLDEIVIRFSGDSGDGMQLTGTIFSNLSAILGNEISTFPDYPAEVRAPQGTLSGVSGFQVHIGSRKIFTPGDKADVLVAMNPAALKVNVKHLKPNAIVLIDTDSFQKSDLEKALFTTDDPFTELGLTGVQVIAASISSMVKEGLKDFGLDNKSALRCKNMFALGLICWLFERPLEEAMHMLQNKFAKKPVIAQANIKALTDGYNYGHNIHASVSTYRIESKKMQPGIYMDVNGNKATSYGLIAAAEKAGLRLFLGSYPITPATDILHELSKRKDLGVITVQAEDEIAGVCTAIGASFAGCLAATSTSGPGLALKSEAIGLAVIAELPLVVIDVQRGGPSTGMPTKSEQTDLLQALYGRNGECPAVVVAAATPTLRNVIVSNENVTLKEGQTKDLTATVTLNDNSAYTVNSDTLPKDLKVTWTVKDNRDDEVSVVKTGNGLGATITALRVADTNERVKEVTVQVTAELNGKFSYATCKVLVQTEDPAGVTVTPATQEIAPGGKIQLHATVKPETNPPATVTWSSKNPAIATVDSNAV